MKVTTLITRKTAKAFALAAAGFVLFQALFIVLRLALAAPDTGGTPVAGILRDGPATEAVRAASGLAAETPEERAALVRLASRIEDTASSDTTRRLAEFLRTLASEDAAAGDRADFLRSIDGISRAFDDTASVASRQHGERQSTISWLDGVEVLSAIAVMLAFGSFVVRPLLRDTAREVAALEDSRDQLAHNALHDHLTGLPNRRYVEEHLDRTLASASRAGNAVAVLQIDLDGFKQINDRYGHAIGDIALTSVARRMQSAIRRADFLGRNGGDEFIVIAEESRNPRGLETLARRLIEQIAADLALDGQSCRIGASIGIALSPPLAPDSGLLLAAADAALYEAKAEGRGSFRFHPDVRSHLECHYPGDGARAMTRQAAE